MPGSSLTETIFGTGKAQKGEETKADLFATQVQIPAPKAYPSSKKKRKPQSEAASKPSLTKKRRNPDQKQGQQQQEQQQETLNEGERTSAPQDVDATHEVAAARTIFVGNLPVSTTRSQLAALFDNVQSARIRSVPLNGGLKVSEAGNDRVMRKVCVNTGQHLDPRAHCVSGYVVLTSIDAVAAALEKNGKRFEIGGVTRTLRVDTATPTHHAATTVFLGNLPFGADEESLAVHIRTHVLDATIVNVRLIRDGAQCKGFGYVQFSEKSAVAQALQQLPDTVYQKRKLRVQVCGKRTKRSVAKLNGVAKKAKEGAASPSVVVAALQRIGRKRSNKPKVGKNKKSVFKSKRAAATSKTDKRVKKLEQRQRKGMGKGKLGS